MSSSRTVITALALAILVLTGCTLQGAFVEDERVEILAPQNRALVDLPVELEWSVEDFTITPPDGSNRDDRGYFGIFIDRAPMPPGDDLESIAEDDPRCEDNPECPDRDWFASEGIFYTTETEFLIETLVDTRPRDRPEAADRHEVTIVLLNGQNERIGETAFKVEFEVRRGATS